MLFNTKTWLETLVIDYDKGQPVLVKYILKDEEINRLTKLVDELSILRIEEAFNNEYKRGIE